MVGKGEALGPDYISSNPSSATQTQCILEQGPTFLCLSFFICKVKESYFTLLVWGKRVSS